MGYPALIVGIILVGSVLTFFARDHRSASAAEAPVANRDHWHAAIGVQLCGQWQPPLHDAGGDVAGIHTHSDGLIHIHPFVGAASGDNATFSVFASQVGIELGDGEFTMPDGTRYANGDDCEVEDGDAVPGEVALVVWPPQATEATEPRIVTEDLGDVRFERDGQIFALAFVPDLDDVGIPPSVEALANPGDLDTQPEPGSVEFVDPALTSTSAPPSEDTGENAPAEGTDTTVPADSATTTTADG